MRSFITALIVTTALATGASSAVARPADSGPQLPAQSQSAEAPASPSLPSDGNEAIVFFLVTTGGIAALLGAAYTGARVDRRIRHTGG
jgi:hypothetical protein